MKRPYYATSVGKQADERRAFLKRYRDFQYPANEQAIAELLSCCFCFVENRLKKEAYDLCYTGDRETAEREAKRIVAAIKAGYSVSSAYSQGQRLLKNDEVQDEDNERETAQNRACAVLSAGRKRTRQDSRKPVQTITGE